LFSNCAFPVLRAATRATSRRPERVGKELLRKLKERKVQNPKILVVGAAFKTGQSSTINSPGIALMKSLRHNATVSFADPLVQQNSIPWANRLDHTLQWNHETLSSFDAIVIAIKQPGLSYEVLEQLNIPVEWYTR
jgi:UDP-N-acetyl-D-mannosaminuronate dehydrogenase